MTPWTAARQASLSITNSQSLLKLMSIELVILSNHLILCCPLLLLPSIFPSIIFSNESVLRINWPKYWSFSFSISPSKAVNKYTLLKHVMGFPSGSNGKESTCIVGDLASTAGSGRSPGEGNGNPLQYSCLENSRERRAQRATVHGVRKSRIQLSD